MKDTGQYKIVDGHQLRWTRNERIQHWSLAISFIILTITGFALKYPEAWWSRHIMGSEFVFDMRSLLHRICGAISLILAVYHVGYLMFTRRGRWQFLQLLPRKKDLFDAFKNLGFNLGLAKKRPPFAHYSYIEKAEYWALVWGSIVMGVTGIFLWFDEFTLTYLPRWTIDLFTVIHLYEAWLAMLAIIVWHFYMVIFRPGVYPLDLSMITGKISEEELCEERYLEYLELQSEEPKSKSNAEEEK